MTTDTTPANKPESHVGRTILKVLLWIIGIPLLLVLLLIIALLIPPVQNFLADKGANYLSETLDTEVRIGSVRTDFRNTFVLEDFYIEDQQNDTLLYAGRFGLDMNFFSLLNSEINISSVSLENATAHIQTFLPDSTTNYDFVLNAFAADTAAAQPVDTTATPFTYNLGDIALKNIFFTMQDQIYGNNIRTRIGSLQAEMDQFNPDKEIYRLNNIALQNSYVNFNQTKVIPDTTTQAEPLTLQFDFNKIALQNVKLNYENKVAAQRIILDVKKSEVVAKDIDLPKGKINLASFDLQNSFIAYFQDKYTPTDSLAVNPAKTAEDIDKSAEATAGAPVNWIVTLDELNVAGTKIQFGNYNTPEQKLGMDFNHLAFSDINLDVNDLYYSQNRIAADLQNLTLQEKSGFEIEKFTAGIVMDSTHAELSDLYLQTGASVIRRHLAVGYPSLETIADNLERLSLDIDLVNTKIGPADLAYFQPALANDPAFRQVLNQPLYIDGRINGPMSNLQVERLQAVGLTGTAMKLSGTIREPMDPEQLYVDLDIDRFTTTRTDVKALLPAGTLPAGYQVPTRLTLTGGITGGMEMLNLQNIRLTAAPNTTLQTSGTIRNLQNPDQLAMNLKVDKLATTRSDLQTFFPPELFPPDIQLPEQMQLSGTFNGSLNNFTTNAKITSSFGNATANIRMSPGERYTGTVSLDNFELGKFLKQEDTYGKISLETTVNGTGLSPENMQGKIDATLKEFEYNNYTYRNVIINGTANNNLFTGVVRVNDPNLDLRFEGTVNMRPEQPVFNFVVNFDEANLQALNFYGENLRLQGKIAVDMKGASLNTVTGTIDAGNLTIRQDAKTYRLDSLLVRVDNSPERTFFSIRSDIIKGFFRGANGAEDLAVAFQKYIDSYFNIQNEPFPENVALKDFTFDFRMGRTDLLTDGLVPDLKKLGPGTMSGTYQSANRDLDVQAYLPLVIYATYHLDSLRFNLDGDPNRLNYAVKMDQLYDSTFQVKNLTLGGFAQNDDLKVRLAVATDNGQDRFALGGTLNDLQNAYRFSFTPGDVILNSEVWNVSPGNYLQYFESGDIYAEDIRLQSNGSALTIDSPGELRKNAPLEIGFTDFRLSDISQAIERNDSLLSGSVNGTITLQDITQKLSFTSDLRVSNFAYQRNLIGDIALQANNAAGDRYNIKAVLTGNGNNTTISGYYVAQATSNALNLTADITSLNLQALQGFMAGVLNDLSGSLTGQLAINGSVSNPDIRGATTFNNATFSLAMFDAKYRLPNETITFAEDGLRFSNFTLVDTTGNKATVNGTMFTQDYIDYRFALDVKANNFILMNSNAADNELYYGKVVVDATARVLGDLNTPIINTNVKVLDNSSLTMVIPTEAADLVEHQGIVEFVDMSDTTRNQLAKQDQRDTLSQTGFTGMDINAVVEVDKGTAVTVILDEATGDFIEIRGEGILNAGIDPSGQIDLSGRYEVSGGKYLLNFYGLAKREFLIDPGSSITWNGTPLDAVIDIKAIYNVEAAPIDLLSNQADPNDKEALSRFRQQVPFNVFVNLEGDMMKPNISFNIVLPEEERSQWGTVENKLELLRQDPSQLNRQVFSLIVLGRFMGENPFESQGGGSLAATARSSISGVLSDQLNQLTGKYLGGLGLELGLDTYEDYSSGEAQNRTDLNVALRQQFLNNRLIVKVGTDVGIEGRNPNSAQGGSGFAGNIAVEYLITADGRLRVRVFKQNAYESFLETEVQETGLALIYQRDFNNFADLFRNMAKSAKSAKRKEPDPELNM